MECLKSSVGLSQRDCECFEDGKPEDFDQSKSGYFLDDKSWGIPLHWTATIKDCGQEGPWKLMQQARDEGINEYLTLINQYLYEYNNDSTNVKDVQIGDKKTTTFITPEKQYAGFRLTSCSKHKSNVLVISKIGLHVLNDTPVTVKIFIDEEEQFSETLTPVNGVVEHTLPSALIYRPFDQYGNIQPLEIVADMQNNEFRNVKFNCLCNGKGNKRYWEYHFDKLSLMGDTFTDMEQSKKNKGLTGGLRIYGIHRCDDQDWICNFAKYEHTAFYRVQSRIIQLLSIQKLIGQILSSGTINRYTILKREELMGKSRSITNKVKNDLTWLALNIPEGLNKCIECKEKRNTRVVQILV